MLSDKINLKLILTYKIDIFIFINYNQVKGDQGSNKGPKVTKEIVKVTIVNKSKKIK